MKLELKHLSAYLPYGLRIFTPVWKTNIVELTTFNYETVTSFATSKPILRPMSDFDKVENDFDLSTDFEDIYLPTSKDLCTINISDKTYLSDMLTLTDFLFKNHFDVFGLIDAGLAIDINTVPELLNG